MHHAAPDEFSIYRWTLEQVELHGATVRRLGGVQGELPHDWNVDFVTGVRAMLHWCRINEELVIGRHGQGARVLAGFERLSRVRPVLGRYRRLSAAVERLVLFGQRDDAPALDAELVDVGAGPMAREWFLLIDAPRYRTLLVARDEVGFGENGPLRGRRFVGLTLHEGTIVRAAAERLMRYASARRTLALSAP